MLSEGARSCRRPSRDVWATLNNFAGLPTPCFITDPARTTAHVIVLDENNFVPENVGLVSVVPFYLYRTRSIKCPERVDQPRTRDQRTEDRDMGPRSFDHTHYTQSRSHL